MELVLVVFTSIYIIPLLLGVGITVYTLKLIHWKKDYIATSILGVLCTILFAPLFLVSQITGPYTLFEAAQLIITIVPPLAALGIVVGTIASWIFRNSEPYTFRSIYYSVLSTLSPTVFVIITQLMQAI